MYVVTESRGLGNPVLALVPGAVSAVESIFGGSSAARTESHIQDRVQKYQSLTNAELQSILPRGGEAAEAARRVLQSRGIATVGGAAAGTGTTGAPLIDLSKIVKLPEVSTTTKVDIPPMLLYGGLALGALVLVMGARRR